MWKHYQILHIQQLKLPIIKWEDSILSSSECFWLWEKSKWYTVEPGVCRERSKCASIHDLFSYLHLPIGTIGIETGDPCLNLSTFSWTGHSVDVKRAMDLYDDRFPEINTAMYEKSLLRASAIDAGHSIWKCSITSQIAHYRSPPSQIPFFNPIVYGVQCVDWISDGVSFLLFLLRLQKLNVLPTWTKVYWKPIRNFPENAQNNPILLRSFLQLCSDWLSSFCFSTLCLSIQACPNSLVMQGTARILMSPVRSEIPSDSIRSVRK